MVVRTRPKIRRSLERAAIGCALCGRAALKGDVNLWLYVDARLLHDVSHHLPPSTYSTRQALHAGDRIG